MEESLENQQNCCHINGDWNHSAFFFIARLLSIKCLSGSSNLQLRRFELWYRQCLSNLRTSSFSLRRDFLRQTFWPAFWWAFNNWFYRLVEATSFCKIWRLCQQHELNRVDFAAVELGLPYLSAYLDSIESDFRHGANFAASGSTIQPVDGKLFDAGFNPLSLSIQLSQFQQFKDRTIELYTQG